MMSGTPDDASAAGSSRAVRLLAGFAALATIAAVLLLPALTPWLLRIEHWTADWRNALLADGALHSNEQIAIVSITDAQRCARQIADRPQTTGAHRPRGRRRWSAPSASTCCSFRRPIRRLIAS